MSGRALAVAGRPPPPRQARRTLGPTEVEKSSFAVRSRLIPKSRKPIAHHFNVAQRDHLLDLSSEEQIQRPADHHSELLSQPRQLRQVHRPPQPPRDEPRKLHPEHHGHASVAADAGQESHCSVPKRLERATSNHGLDVLRGRHALPQTVLCRWPTQRARRDIRYCGAIASRRREGGPVLFRMAMMR